MTHKTHAFILSGILLFLLVIYFFFFTTFGLEILVKLSLSKYAKFREISINKVEGNILSGVKIDNLRVNRLKKIPEDVVIKVQQAEFNIAGFTLKSFDLKISNGRVEIAKSQPIIFGGTYKKGKLNFNIYAKAVDIKSCLWLFSDSVILKNATSGEIVEPDFYLTGKQDEKELKGKMYLKKVTFDKYSLLDCPVIVRGMIYSEAEKVQVKGNVELESGMINLGGSIIKKVKGKILFLGDPYNPAFDLEGDSVVGGTRIHILYKGTYLKPELRLTSEPPMSEEDLLVMLFTGNIFKGESRNLGAELKVTDRVSIEGATQLKNQEDKTQDINQKTNDKILLKYKNKF